MKANNLREIETILVSTPRVIMNPASSRDPWKKKKVEHMVTLLKGALLAEQKVMLKMNVHRDNLDRIIALLPALRKPTISALSEDQWVAVESVVDDKKVRRLICELKRSRGRGHRRVSLKQDYPLKICMCHGPSHCRKFVARDFLQVDGSLGSVII